MRADFSRAEGKGRRRRRKAAASRKGVLFRSIAPGKATAHAQTNPRPRARRSRPSSGGADRLRTRYFRRIFPLGKNACPHRSHFNRRGGLALPHAKVTPPTYGRSVFLEGCYLEIPSIPCALYAPVFRNHKAEEKREVTLPRRPTLFGHSKKSPRRSHDDIIPIL